MSEQQGENSKRPRSPDLAAAAEHAEKKVHLDESSTSTAPAVAAHTASAASDQSIIGIKMDNLAPGSAAPAPVVATSAAAEEIDEESAFNASSLSGSGSKKSFAKRGPNKRAREEYKKDKKEGAGAGSGSKRRPWEREKRDNVPPKAEGEEGEGDGESGRLPKRRCALLIGYCGTGYSGMQIQTHGSRTIEGDVFAALVKAGAVSSDNSNDHRKVDVMRAARTDAGVHAAGNCISLKMIYEPPLPEGFTTLADYVNSFLPDQIKMWGFVRTVKSFNARTACDSRIYEYLLPSYCLLPPGANDPLAKRLDESSPGWRERLRPATDFVDAAPALPVNEEGETVLDPKQRGEFERRREWRCDPGTLGRFRELIAQYKGTHNFHNYTVGKPFHDRSVKRYMLRLDVKDPQVYGDIEWISVQIHGQSFMLHQIRKMISMAMLACRTGSPPSLIPETFGPKRIHVPKAPPLGLLLEAPQFGMYNDRITNKLNGMQDDRDPIQYSLYAEKIHEFKVRWIYEKLRQEELESHVFHKWMRQMDNSSSAGLAFLNAQGVIPAEADLTRRPKEEGKTKDADGKDDLESEDEEVDDEALKRGELEG